jgi:hypothetical protein
VVPRNSNGRFAIYFTLGLQAVHSPRALSQSIRSSHYRRIFPHLPVVLQARPFRPVQVMDNEAPKALRQYFISNDIRYEFVPPHTKRSNEAERAIQTFKRHFISILANTHPSFPINFWHELIPQAEITFNMMRKSHYQVRLSCAALGNSLNRRTPLQHYSIDLCLSLIGNTIINYICQISSTQLFLTSHWLIKSMNIYVPH